jgi:N-methylhydantoinase B/oxoprolinase/acetone carboxylase alpha subunit
MNYSALSMPRTQMIDEFGRDMLLRNPKHVQDHQAYTYITSIRKLLETMSWAELTFLEEEEEERKKEELEKLEQKKQAEKNKKHDLQRKTLLVQGKYELEDGEVVE